MSFGSTSQPAVDPAALIQAQADMNRINVNSPFGTQTFSGPGNNVMDINFSKNQGQLQQLGEQYGIQSGNMALNQLNQLAGMGPVVSQIDMSGISGAPVEQATFDRGKAMLDPVFDDRRGRLEQTTATRGIPTGSRLSSRLGDDLNRAEERAFSDLQNRAVLAGRGEESRLFNQALQQAALSNSSRGIPFNELSYLRGGTAPTMPTTFAPANVNVMEPLRMEQDAAARNDAYKASIYGSLAGLGSALGSGYLLK